MASPRHLIIEPEAEAELAEGMDWYEAQQPGLGAALFAEVEEVLTGLELGELVSVPVPFVRTNLPVRRVHLDRFPYAVVFLEHGDQTHILAIAHFKRRPGYWASRLRSVGRE
ncbi:MAG: type II toxin-antitoxin system RelE/ParE family toxin [Myxococcales bacterium]|nr:type II toxin-antitoxin system RelE/ParE family toxin [Myxococcales bacterium]